MPKPFDPGWLIVWPEWASSGVWHPQRRDCFDGPVQHVEHESIGLPADLRQAFDAWIAWFDDAAPGSSTLATFDQVAFEREGRRLTAALAAFVGDRFVVRYARDLQPPAPQDPAPQDPAR